MKFVYTAFDKSGKSTTATVDAASPAEASESLRRQGLFVSEIRPVSDSAQQTPGPTRITGRIGTGQRLKNLAMLSRQLHVLISSGTPIVQALSAIERQCDNEHWRAVVAQLRARVEEGTPLSEAMRQMPGYFDSVCRSLVAAGESSGNMPVMLDRLAALSRKQLQLRNSVLGAMVYPCLLMGIGLIVLIVMLMFVLPRFSGLFESLDSPLPPTTKMLLWISEMLWNWWWGVLIWLIGSGIGAYYWLCSPGGKKSLHSAMLNLPKFGRLSRNLASAKLSRMLGTLLESHVPLLDALQLTRQSVVIVHYSDLLGSAEEAVTRGEPISAVLGNSNLISACVQESLRNGEQTGKIGSPLLQMADFLDEENDIVIKSLTSILEPTILIILGIVVGFIAISMFLPLFDLVSATQGGG